VEGADEHWPRFRGPSGQGLTGGAKIPVKWDKDGTNLLWRVKLEHKGNSSPVVWGDHIFLTSSNDDGSARFVECRSLQGGKLVWKQQAPARPPEPKVRQKNGYASATPVTDGERAVVFLGSCGLLCYDFEGKLLWQFDKLKFDTTHGTGSSPLLYKDKVLFIHDQNRGESFFLALDKHTGKLLWKKPRPQAMTWATPVVVRVKDRDELVFAGGEKVNAYNPDTGEELWSLSGPTREVIPAVVIGKDLLYSASGRNGPIIALRPGGKGDVTETHVAWQITRGGAHVPTPLYLDGKLYAVSDTGILSCLDGSTGKLIWQTRVLDGFSASPVAASGHIYFPAESGRTYVIRAGDSFHLESRNDLGAPILASPAVVGNRMIIRTEEELVCIGD
jgi:outer membrane protein assembly factor BamB